MHHRVTLTHFHPRCRAVFSAAATSASPKRTAKHPQPPARHTSCPFSGQSNLSRTVRQIPQDSQANSPKQSQKPPQIPSENPRGASKKGHTRCRCRERQTIEAGPLRKWNVSPLTTPERFPQELRESPHEISARVGDRNSATPSP